MNSSPRLRRPCPLHGRLSVTSLAARCMNSHPAQRAPLIPKEAPSVHVRSIDNCPRCSLHRVCFAPGALRQSCAVPRLPVHPGKLAPGEVLYVAGQGCSALYALRSGCIKDVVTRRNGAETVSYTHLRAHETRHDLVCRLLL